MLPHDLVANATYPYDEKLELARRFLQTRGITNPRPIRRSLPQSDAYRAWLAHARPKPKLALVRARTAAPPTAWAERSFRTEAAVRDAPPAD